MAARTLTTKKKAAPRMKAAAGDSDGVGGSDIGGDAKAAAVAVILASLQDDLASMLGAARSAHAAATHEEARPENDKDTRGLEQSYLAAGQAARASELQRAVAALKTVRCRTFGPDDAVDVTAVVRLRDDDTDVISRIFLLPVGAGAVVTMAGGSVQVVNPGAPLGRGVMGKRRGDLAEMIIAGKRRTFEIDMVD